jgi:hypothetical protein
MLSSHALSGSKLEVKGCIDSCETAGIGGQLLLRVSGAMKIYGGFKEEQWRPDAGCSKDFTLSDTRGDSLSIPVLRTGKPGIERSFTLYGVTDSANIPPTGEPNPPNVSLAGGLWF